MKMYNLFKTNTMVLLYNFRRVTRQSSTPKKEGVIQFKGKELRLDLRSRHEKRKRGCKPKAVEKPEHEEGTIEFEDSEEEDEDVKASISDILGGLYASDGK